MLASGISILTAIQCRQSFLFESSPTNGSIAFMSFFIVLFRGSAHDLSIGSALNSGLGPVVRASSY